MLVAVIIVEFNTAYYFRCPFINIFMTVIHYVQKKTSTYVFDYNFSVSWSIFIIFVPMETEMYILQFAYLMAE